MIDGLLGMVVKHDAIHDFTRDAEYSRLIDDVYELLRQ